MNSRWIKELNKNSKLLKNQEKTRGDTFINLEWAKSANQDAKCKCHKEKYS